MPPIQLRRCGVKGNYRHGMRHTRIYNIWRSMRQRCTNPKCINYKNYGGRGIKVCPEWEQFQTFHKWAIDNGYSDELTIDRIDVNGNYEPSNCRWISYKEQSNNKTNNRRIEVGGEVHTMSEWAEIKGIKVSVIWYRLESGWTPERAVNEPAFCGKNQYLRS